MSKKYPQDAYNLITLLGVGLALFAVAAIVILFVMDHFSGGSNPYLGIFTFLMFPGILVLGLVLIPLGMWRRRRAMRLGTAKTVVMDLANPSHRNALVTFVAGTSIFLLLTTVGLYQGYQYTESVEFCGEVCHTVMEPEYTAYLNSPHAQVECVHCHIGPGAGWYVQSKISGARQVLKVLTDTYPRPIPTPVEHLRPAQEVCEQCHWPEKFYRDALVTRDHYLADEKNTHWQIKLVVPIGGTARASGKHATGLHWHIDPSAHMTYVAEDSTRQSFRQVTWTRDGEEVVYAKRGKPMDEAELAEARADRRVRTFDCMDCHNRPSHVYKSPMHAVNEAMASGKLDPSIPWIKHEAVRVMSIEYFTSEGARDSITAGLKEFYEGEGLELPEAAIETVLDLYARNNFPAMRVRWDRYPENRGHFIYTGCFRCHGSDLETQSGETISADCNLCHRIVAQGNPDSLKVNSNFEGMVFEHPVDIDGAELEMHCTDCHLGDDSNFMAWDPRLIRQWENLAQVQPSR